MSESAHASQVAATLGVSVPLMQSLNNARLVLLIQSEALQVARDKLVARGKLFEQPPPDLLVLGAGIAVGFAHRRWLPLAVSTW